MIVFEICRIGVAGGAPADREVAESRMGPGQRDRRTEEDGEKGMGRHQGGSLSIAFQHYLLTLAMSTAVTNFL
jgi:hypothetical protein